MGLWIGVGASVTSAPHALAESALGGAAPSPNTASSTAAAASALPVAPVLESSAFPFGYEIVHGASFEPGGAAAAGADADGTPRVLVGCITTDFAMQNVLLQLGLQLASTGGKVVRSVKSWVFKCDACFTICTDMSKLFCPRCGGATLARLGVTVGPDGAPRYHYKRERTFNNRGTIFPLPAPRGGRDAMRTDLLLREDQLLTGAWAVKVRTGGAAAEREGLCSSRLALLPGASGGGADTGGGGGGGRRGGTSGTDVAGSGIVVGYGRRNPNASRGGRRK